MEPKEEEGGEEDYDNDFDSDSDSDSEAVIVLSSSDLHGSRLRS